MSEDKQHLSRKDFLKAVGLAGGAAVLGALGISAINQASKEADVGWERNISELENAINKVYSHDSNDMKDFQLLFAGVARELESLDEIPRQITDIRLEVQDINRGRERNTFTYARDSAGETTLLVDGTEIKDINDVEVANILRTADLGDNPNFFLRFSYEDQGNTENDREVGKSRVVSVVVDEFTQNVTRDNEEILTIKVPEDDGEKRPIARLNVSRPRSVIGGEIDTVYNYVLFDSRGKTENFDSKLEVMLKGQTEGEGSNAENLPEIYTLLNSFFD